MVSICILLFDILRLALTVQEAPQLGLSAVLNRAVAGGRGDQYLGSAWQSRHRNAPSATGGALVVVIVRSSSPLNSGVARGQLPVHRVCRSMRSLVSP